MIELIVMLLVSLNGTDDNDDWISDDNSTISGCDYYGGGNLRLDCLEEDCPPDHYGPGHLDDLLDRWCTPESDCPIIDGLGRGQDLVYRQYCDRSLEPDGELNDNDEDLEFHPDQ